MMLIGVTIAPGLVVHPLEIKENAWTHTFRWSPTLLCDALNDLFAEELKGPLKDFAIEVRFGDDQAETVDLRWQSRPHTSFPFLHRSRLSRQILSCNQICRRISNSRYFEFRFLKIFDFIREFIGTFSTEVDEIQRLECTNRQILPSYAR